MSNEPHVIAYEKLVELIVELIVGLGIDPDMDALQSVSINTDGVTVVRVRLNEQGRVYVVGNEFATETVTIRIER